MAKKGTATAYQRLTPISTNFGQISNDQYQKFERRRLEEKADEEKRKNKLANLNKQYAQDLANLKPVITGIRNKDEINYRAAASAKRRMGDIYREFKNDPTKEGDVSLQLELANLRQFPELLSQLDGRLTNYAKDLSEGLQSGKYSDIEQEKLDELEAFFAVQGEDGRFTPNYIIDFDDQGLMTAKGLTGDGKYFEKSIMDIMNGYEYSAPIERVDKSALVKGITDQLGKKERHVVKGGFSKIIQDFESIEGDASVMIDNLLQDDGNPSAQAKSIWVDTYGQDLEDLDKEGIEFIKKDILEDIKVGYDQTVKVTQFRAPSGSKKDETFDRNNNIFLIKDPKTGKSVGDTVPDPLDPTRKTVKFAIKKKPIIKDDNREIEIEELTIDGNNRITIHGKTRKAKSDKSLPAEMGKIAEREYTTFKSDKIEDVSQAAVQLGFSDADELYQYLWEQSFGKEERGNNRKERFRGKYNY